MVCFPFCSFFVFLCCALYWLRLRDLFLRSFVLWIVVGCQWVSDNLSFQPIHSFAYFHILFNYKSFHPIQYLCFSHILFLTSLFTVHVIIRIIYYPISSNPAICNCLCVFRCLICINPFIRLFSYPIFNVSVSTNPIAH